MTEMCRVFIHGHSDYKNVFALRLICEVVVQRWTFTISLPIFFIQLSFLFVNTSIIFPEMQHALRLAIIYHAEKKNTRTEIQKYVIFCQKCRLAKA